MKNFNMVLTLLIGGLIGGILIWFLKPKDSSYSEYESIYKKDGYQLLFNPKFKQKDISIKQKALLITNDTAERMVAFREKQLLGGKKLTETHFLDIEPNDISEIIKEMKDMNGEKGYRVYFGAYDSKSALYYSNQFQLGDSKKVKLYRSAIIVGTLNGRDTTNAFDFAGLCPPLCAVKFPTTPVAGAKIYHRSLLRSDVKPE